MPIWGSWSICRAATRALTRRAREESGLSVVVVLFNRRRARCERRGVLVEVAGLGRGGACCVADREARRRGRLRDAGEGTWGGRRQAAGGRRQAAGGRR
ncbi:hypothetical protein ACFRFC_35605, partial [Streptomyces sp. NPDC056734]